MCLTSCRAPVYAALCCAARCTQYCFFYGYSLVMCWGAFLMLGCAGWLGALVLSALLELNRGGLGVGGPSQQEHECVE